MNTKTEIEAGDLWGKPLFNKDKTISGQIIYCVLMVTPNAVATIIVGFNATNEPRIQTFTRKQFLARKLMPIDPPDVEIEAVFNIIKSWPKG